MYLEFLSIMIFNCSSLCLQFHVWCTVTPDVSLAVLHIPWAAQIFGQLNEREKSEDFGFPACCVYCSLTQITGWTSVNFGAFSCLKYWLKNVIIWVFGLLWTEWGTWNLKPSQFSMWWCSKCHICLLNIESWMHLLFPNKIETLS